MNDQFLRDPGGIILYGTLRPTNHKSLIKIVRAVFVQFRFFEFFKGFGGQTALKNQKFKKMKKTPGDIVDLYLHTGFH